ncbi:MAG TPA: hypothetical protein VNZ58_14420 [Thermomicrobiales bacterium]|nr:hypothetical protein [Thermomicrobiales bacterium]
MSDRDESTGTETPEEMRPLPDGGLSDAMPDWLRRPPAWRELPRKDDPVPSQRTLPDPDTSVIDPRELITVDDLPQWLRDIAAREHEPETTSIPELPVRPEKPEPTATPETTPAPDATEPTTAVPIPGTALWIWAMRVAIVLIILAIIYYVFIL